MEFSFLGYCLDVCHELSIFKEICKAALSACSISTSTCLLCLLNLIGLLEHLQTLSNLLPDFLCYSPVSFPDWCGFLQWFSPFSYYLFKNAVKTQRWSPCLTPVLISNCLVILPLNFTLSFTLNLSMFVWLICCFIIQTKYIKAFEQWPYQLSCMPS